MLRLPKPLLLRLPLSQLHSARTCDARTSMELTMVMSERVLTSRLAPISNTTSRETPAGRREAGTVGQDAGAIQWLQPCVCAPTLRPCASLVLVHLAPTGHPAQRHWPHACARTRLQRCERLKQAPHACWRHGAAPWVHREQHTGAVLDHTCRHGTLSVRGAPQNTRVITRRGQLVRRHVRSSV